MFVKNWYVDYDSWRLLDWNKSRWGNHNYIDYHNDVDELLRTTMLEF